MVRILSVAAALAVSGALLSSTAAYAQAPATGYYAATPAATPKKTQFLTRDTVWRWQDGAYTAKKSPERDVTLCALVAKQAGKLTAFSVGGTPFPADQLDKCNERAG